MENYEKMEKLILFLNLIYYVSIEEKSVIRKHKNEKLSSLIFFLLFKHNLENQKGLIQHLILIKFYKRTANKNKIFMKTQKKKRKKTLKTRNIIIVNKKQKD